MTTAKRTGDEDNRIVHGGELPEDEGSLDDVVADESVSNEQPLSPSPRNPGELWTIYFMRRLADEGMNPRPKDWGLEEIELAAGDLRILINYDLFDLSSFSWEEYIDFVYNQASKDGSFFPNRDYKDLDLRINVVKEEGLDFIWFEGIYDVGFKFRPDGETAELKSPGTLSPQDGCIPPIGWFFVKYRNKGTYPAQQVVDDAIRYIKEMETYFKDNNEETYSSD